MKLLVVVAVALCVSSASSTFFGRRKTPKVVDIHITQGIPPIQSAPGQGAPVVVEEVPVGSYLPVQVGHVQVNQPSVGIKSPVPSLGHHSGSINVPVVSSHKLHVIPIQVEQSQYLPPHLVSVEPSVQGVQLLFKSASSPLFVRQQHQQASGAVYQVTRSEDHPHVLRHEVVKPVVQELREIIQPIRHVSQEIKPVVEQVNIYVPKGQHQGPRHPLPPSPAQQAKVHFPRHPAPPTKGQQQIVQEPIEQEHIEQVQQVEQDPIKV